MAGYISLIEKNKLRDYIIDNISQEEIFAYYFGIDISEVRYCLEDRLNRICNPLRDDRHPSLSFKYSDRNPRKLQAKDWGNNYYNGDCFHIAGIVLGLACNNKVDFIKICHNILNKIPYNVKHIYLKKEDTSKPIEIKPLETIERGWIEEDVKYWNKYTIPTWFLERNNIIPVFKAWYNNVLVYNNNLKDVGYAYKLNISLFSKGLTYDIPLVKLYFPLRPKPRFITNSKLQIEDIEPLVYTDNLIIVKSIKDKIFLKWVKYLISISPKYKGIRVDNIHITSFSSESIMLCDDDIAFLKSKYKKIFIFNDFDSGGIPTSFQYFSKGFIPIFLKDTKVHLKMFEGFVNKYNNFNYNAKDITDYQEKNGINRSIRLIVKFIEKCI